MSERKENTLLADLPCPTSPASLDEKILSYAREQAPQPTSWWRSGWAGGLVTAGIVVVAVLIADPLQQAPSFRSDDLQTKKSPVASVEAHSEDTLVRLQSAPLSVAINIPSPATLETEQAPTLEQNAHQVREVRSAAKAQLADAQAQYDMAGNAFAEETVITAKKREVAKSSTIALLKTPNVLEEVELVQPIIELNSDTRIALEALEKMLHAGRESQARLQYTQLRKQCTHCNLPPLLEDGLADLSKLKDAVGEEDVAPQ